MEGGSYLPLEVPPTLKLYFRVQYKSEIEWCTILSPSTYEAIINAVKVVFPVLENVDFILQDEFGANLRNDFLEEYIKISSRGVLLKVREPDIQNLSTATTLTNYSLSVESPPSVESWSDASSYADNNSPSTSGIRILTSHKQTIVSPEQLKEYILNAPGGKEIFQFYNRFSTLNDEYRKKVVNISVNYLQQLFPEHSMPSAFSREQCAKSLVSIFPSLKDKGSPEGFEAFFDPITKKGFLTTRLRTLLRRKDNIFTPKKRKLEVEVKKPEAEDKSENIEDAINFIKHADPSQEIQIQEKLQFSFAYRRKHGSEMLPRFFDTRGLISYEFSLIHPGTENSFLHNWNQHCEKILKVYALSVKNPLSDIVTENEIDTSGMIWNKDSRALFALVLLLPPTAKGRGKVSRESNTSAQDHLLTFQRTDVPINNILETRRSQQPFLLAVGPNKAAIENYFIVFDNNIISVATVTGKIDIVHAFDVLFKTFFVFSIEYPQPLKYFWEFVQSFFYNIHQGIAFTSRMRELRTKLYNLV